MFQYNRLHSKIGTPPLEAFFKEYPKEIEEPLNHMGNIYNPFTRENPPIEGGRLIVEGGKSRKLVTTIGTFDITSWADIHNLLKRMNKRILVKGQRKNDISTLIKWYPKDMCRNFSLSGGAKQAIWLSHPEQYYVTDNIVQWRPCPCGRISCPYKQQKLGTGWIEDIKEIWEVLGEKDPDPSPEKIKKVFSSIEEELWVKESLSIKFFTQPGRVMGQILLTYLYTLINKYGMEEDQTDLWNEALAMAKSGAFLGLSWLEEAIITEDATNEDRDTSHFASLGDTAVLTPSLVKVEKVEGRGVSEESYWEKIDKSVEAISVGIQMPPGNIPPRQHRLPSSRGGKEYGVLPTHYAIRDIIDRINIMGLGREGYIPIRTFFFFKKYEGPTIKYWSLVKKIYGYAQIPSPFGKYMKYITKIGVGKLNSYWIEKKIRILGYNPEGEFLGKPVWLPLNPLSSDYEGPGESEAKLGPTTHFLVAASVYGREENVLRWQVMMRSSKGRPLHLLRDGFTYGGEADLKVKKSIGGFRPKSKPGQRIGTLSDVHISYPGDGHAVDWLAALDNSDPNSTEIKGEPKEYRIGLEAFKRYPLNEAYEIFGTIEEEIPTCKLGSRKLLGGETRKSDLSRGKRFRMAETRENIGLIVDGQEGEQNE